MLPVVVNFCTAVTRPWVRICNDLVPSGWVAVVVAMPLASGRVLTLRVSRPKLRLPLMRPAMAA